jgi:hypothetical protein
MGSGAYPCSQFAAPLPIQLRTTSSWLADNAGRDFGMRDPVHMSVPLSLLTK